jgi:hypothetical protein
MMRRILMICSVALGCATVQAAERPFLQLQSTRYPTGATRPAEGTPPVRDFSFVKGEALPKGAKVLSAARAGAKVWVVTDQGPFKWENDRFVPLETGPRVLEPNQPPVKASARIAAVEGDGVGHIWVATDRALYVTDGDQWWQSIDRRDGVPYEVITCLHLAPNGDLWAGTPEGAWRLRDGGYRHFWGKRWIPGNAVQAIWTDAKGRVWIETDGGAGCIQEVPMTLAEKAAHYDAITQARHNRRGFIAGIDLKEEGDPSKGYHFDVSDNDGLWTSLYVAAMAFRYGATQDPKARAQAKQSMEALLDLERKSGIKGFPARAMATEAEIQAGARGVNKTARVHAPGVDVKVWYESKDEPGLWLKGDTSSDEIDGHYLAWFLYHDLVADAAEKAEIQRITRRVTDHILDHGLTLVDHTGVKTRWGIWAPELINKTPYYHELRPLNSLEILAFLKTAHHLTGEPRYEKAYEDLIEKHHYLLNGLMMRRGAPGQWPGINHSDDELLYMVYYPLLRLEKNPARRRLLNQSLARTWEGSHNPLEQPLRPERSPLYNFIYGVSTGRPCDVEASVETLQDWPWELIDWPTMGSRRHDVQVRIAPGVVRNREQLDRVLPISERNQGRWNANPWMAEGKGNGRHEHDGVAWSVAYWLGRYHQLID